MIAYYISRKLEGSSCNNDDTCKVSVYDEYKDFFFLAKVGAVAIGVTAAVGMGVWLYSKNKCK